LTIVSQPEGAVELLRVQDISSLIEIASHYPLVLEVVKYMWLNASTIPDEIQAVRTNVDKIIPSLVVVFKGTDAVTFISFLGDLLPKLDQEVSSPRRVCGISLILTTSRLYQATRNGSSL
jgi:hypothetical protein